MERPHVVDNKPRIGSAHPMLWYNAGLYDCFLELLFILNFVLVLFHPKCIGLCAYARVSTLQQWLENNSFSDQVLWTGCSAFHVFGIRPARFDFYFDVHSGIPYVSYIDYHTIIFFFFISCRTADPVPHWVTQKGKRWWGWCWENSQCHPSCILPQIWKVDQ